MTAVLYTRVGCQRCAELAATLREAGVAGLVAVDVDAEAALAARYGAVVPVVVLNDRYWFLAAVDGETVRAAVERLQD